MAAATGSLHPEESVNNGHPCITAALGDPSAEDEGAPAVSLLQVKCATPAGILTYSMRTGTAFF